MAAVGTPYENAQAESFFKTLKCEEVFLDDYRTFAEAEDNIGHFIADVYNAKRLHSCLGSMPPVEFESTGAYHREDLPASASGSGNRVRSPHVPGD